MCQDGTLRLESWVNLSGAKFRPVAGWLEGTETWLSRPGGASDSRGMIPG